MCIRNIENNRNTKMLTLEALVEAIEQLENDGVLTFENFKKLNYQEIKEHYFAMPARLQLKKAIIKIEDKRNNVKGLSELTEITDEYIDGILKRTKVRTYYF